MSLLAAGSFLWVTAMVALLLHCYMFPLFDDRSILTKVRPSMHAHYAYQAELDTDSAYHVIHSTSGWVPPETDTESGSDESSMSLEERFEYELSLVPSSDLEYLKSNGWSFELTGMDLAEEYGYSMSVVGITDYEEKVVYIARKYSAIRRATIHEIGHALARQHGSVDGTNEFIGIFNDEKWNFTDCTSVGDGHERSSASEYFASVYQNMILDYSETKSECPETVAYIERVLWGVAEEPVDTPTPSPTATPSTEPVVTEIPAETTLNEEPSEEETTQVHEVEESWNQRSEAA